MKTDSAELCSITNLADYAGQHTQRGLAFAWRQSKDEEEEQVSGEWWRTRY